MVIPCLTYLATASQLWPTHNTFIVDMGENANFSTFLPRLVTLCSITTILVGKKWYLIVVFICISPLANDARLFFMYLPAIFVSSLQRCLFELFAYFSKELFICIFIIVFQESLIHFGQSPGIWFANVFSHSESCHLTLLMVTFEAETFLILMKSNLPIFPSLAAYAFGISSWLYKNGHVWLPCATFRQHWKVTYPAASAANTLLFSFTLCPLLPVLTPSRCFCQKH